ncbi:DUF1534 domain-containing protein, partial [Pseudomonas syringae pv. actinidiae]|nr:DUF1534 domain-containing protein [Pseudomonas syringae pv. actinidiae]
MLRATDLRRTLKIGRRASRKAFPRGAWERMKSRDHYRANAPRWH